MISRDADVLIVGAGPAGTACAWMLARAGHDVLLIDRARFPRPKPCAEYLSPEALRVLEMMDVRADVERAGAVHLTGMEVRAPNGAVLMGEFGAAREFHGLYADGLAIRREKLDALLLDAAVRAGARCLQHTRVGDLAFDAHGRVEGVVTTAGETLRARFVIGADGLRSVVARRLDVGGYARWPRRMAFVAHYRGVSGMNEHGEMHVTRNGYAGMATVDEGLVNVALVVPVRRATGAKGDAGRFLDAWLARNPHLALRFANATRLGDARAVGPFGWSTRRAYAPGGGAALVGDAADFFDPFTGEGIYAALHGAELLVPRLDRALQGGEGERAMLRDYEEARRRAFGGKWTIERIIAFVVGWPVAINRAARGLQRRRDLADTLVAVTGDVVPATAVLRPGYALALLRAAFL
jgi:flavin-dependent dehydrogenase